MLTKGSSQTNFQKKEWDEKKNNEQRNLDKYKQLLPMWNNVVTELGSFENGGIKLLDNNKLRGWSTLKH